MEIGDNVRKRIEELAKGKAESVRPNLEFSVDRIELNIRQGQDYTGEFKIISKNQTPIRGRIYASHPRMECFGHSVQGEEILVSYRFHGKGLPEGDVYQGDFFLISNQGEYNLSFVVSIVRAYAETKQGEMRSLRDFAELAREHWQEARRIFYKPDFVSVLAGSEARIQLLYQGLAEGARSDRCLEEFLLSCGLKDPVTVKAGQSEFLLEGVTETLQQNLILSKNTWGYLELEMTSDADFIRPRKETITAADFLGSEANVGFYLHPEKMHPGNNYGCLTIRQIGQEIRIPICATLALGKGGRSLGHMERKRLRAELLQGYVRYRLKKTVTGKWAVKACESLDKLTAWEPKNIWYRLMKAQVFWLNGQRQEAEWILNEFKRTWKNKTVPEWGYYLYICTLMEREEAVIGRLCQEAELIYLEYQENTLLFWCMLFLREEYANNRYRRYKALERRIMQGEDSPFLYVEVYCLLIKEPYLLKRLGAFEIKILNWARKQGAMTPELARQAGTVFPERLPYRKLVFTLLQDCYALTDDKNQILSVLCGYLIRNQMYGKPFFSWYAKGVEERLRITGLYEAYLLSMDARGVQEVPKVIQMYFKYNNQLGCRQKAILYVNLIASKTRKKELYIQHYPAMEQFAYGQMERGHIDDNLAVIYEDVLSHGICSPQVSGAFADILFVHRLTCFDARAVKVIVRQKQLREAQIVPLAGGVAYFALYSNDYRILVEDCHGNRYAGSLSYQLEKLMYPGKYLRDCMKQSPDQLPYLLYYFSSREAQEIFEEKDIQYFRAVMASEKIDRLYQAGLFLKLFRLLCFLGRTEEMERELERMDLSLLSARDRNAILPICIEQKLYRQAYRMVEAYGFGDVRPADRACLLSSRIQQIEYANDPVLVLLCADTFLAGKYSETMLKYLCMYYQGPTKVMSAIFKSASAFLLDTQAIAERILVQALFTAKFIADIGAIYQSYAANGRRMVKAAYLTWFSYLCFVKDMIPPDGFYDALRAWQSEENELNEVCGLALLKYYAMYPSVLEQEEERAEELLKKCLLRGRSFAFFKKLSHRIIAKYQLDDKYFIEYHTGANRQVWLHAKLRDTDDYQVEEMPEAYEGIYVIEKILFADEAIQYYISEELDGQKAVTKSGVIPCEPMPYRDEMSRYERLNEMLLLHPDRDAERLLIKMQEFAQLNAAVETLFTIIE